MDDRRLDELLDDVKESYRRPPALDTDALWHSVEAEVFASAATPRRRWLMPAVAAASLLIGVVVGRGTAPGASAKIAAAEAPTATPATVVAAPYQQATEEVLARAAVLLAALRATDASGAVSRDLPTQATRLLGTTRLLIDSPASTDPRMRNLLLDLELTLARVARMQPARGDADLMLINEAVAERDIVPRIRSAVVDLSAGAY
jgi:hypothetical protein